MRLTHKQVAFTHCAVFVCPSVPRMNVTQDLAEIDLKVAVSRVTRGLIEMKVTRLYNVQSRSVPL